VTPNEVKAKEAVIKYWETIEKTPVEPVLVWFCYILGGWKALLFIQEYPGNYFEVTYNVAKNETYLDHYVKKVNKVM
jgi:hypothetical protein